MSDEKTQSTPREELQADVICVGAGIASLSAAIRLLEQAGERGGEKPHVVIFEKGTDAGAHVLSGAVIRTQPFRTLLGEHFEQMPLGPAVNSEALRFLTPGGSLRLPWIPAPMKARGLHLASLSDITRWLAARAEELGAEVYPEMAVTDLIIEENRVTGVRLGDKGIDADGRPKPNYTPGAVVHAEAVVLGEGACGLLTAQAVDRFELDKDASPQTYALGIKELLHVPADSQRPGTVLHTFGFPLDADTFGGGFVYGMDAETVAVGLVVGLDYRNPEIDPHASFRAFKAHPAVQQHIAGGEVRSYGAKIIPEGGYFAVPRLAAPGVLLVGDGAGLLDATGLKGAHIACECGLFAGDTLAACWKENAWDKPRLQQYEDRVHESGSWKHQERYRNVRAAFQHGRLAGMLAMGTALFTRGRLPAGRLSSRADHELIGKSDIAPAFRKPQPGRGTDLDMLSDLYASGTVHEEDQPSHLTIRDRKRCVEECLSLYGAPCTRFCPAQVYEMDEETGELRINAANCLHCKTCRIKCPLQQVDWALPEGGGGPRYRGM